MNCVPIPIENCDEATSRWECSKCKSTHALDTYGTYIINPFKFNFSWALTEYNYLVQYHPCLPIAEVKDLKNQFVIRKII